MGESSISKGFGMGCGCLLLIITVIALCFLVPTCGVVGLATLGEAVRTNAPAAQPPVTTNAPASAVPTPTPPSTNAQAIPAIPAPSPVAQPPATTNAANQSTPAPTPPTFPNDWTFNGKTLHNVKVGKVEDYRVHITYDGGVGTFALADLPPDLQKLFNYDPAKAKAAQDAQAQAQDAQAQAQADAERPQKEVNAYLAVLRAADPHSTIVKSVSVDGDYATIVVSDYFHASPYQTRLQAAQNFQKVWASIHSPTDLDKAHIRLTDQNDNEVGSSGIMGSSISVQKE